MGTASRLTRCSVSVVIPAYNEAGRIGPTLRTVSAYFHNRRTEFEILVVDDGSTDTTAAVVHQLSDLLPEVRLLRLPMNRGKGAAVRTGMLAAAGDLLLFLDADGATPIDEFASLLDALEQGADVAIGSRSLASERPGFCVVAQRHRTVIGGLFNRLVQALAVTGIADTQCGFKLFRRAVARDLFAVGQIEGFGFDIELLFVARLRGYWIAELPVNWMDQPGSKVRLVRDGVRTLKELWAIRRHHLSARYSPRPVSPATSRPLFWQEPA